MERTTPSWVVSSHLAQVGMVLQLSAEELAGDVEGLGADDNDLLAVEQLLCDNTGESTEEVTLAIDDDNRLE